MFRLDALWRTSAWTRRGSPKPEFRLSADLILAAESGMIEVLREAATH